jgi:hypothetical protein
MEFAIGMSLISPGIIDVKSLNLLTPENMAIRLTSWPLRESWFPHLNDMLDENHA